MVVLTHLSKNLARLLCLRLAFNLDNTTIMSYKSLDDFVYEIIERSDSYFGIKIAHDSKEYGFDVFVNVIGSVDPTMFSENVKRLPVQLLLQNKKTIDANEWNINDLYIDQLSASQWVECSLMKETLPNFKRLQELSLFKIPGISVREIPCTLLTMFSQKHLPVGKIIIFYNRCSGIHETPRQAEIRPNKPNIGS